MSHKYVVARMYEAGERRASTSGISFVLFPVNCDRLLVRPLFSSVHLAATLIKGGRGREQATDERKRLGGPVRTGATGRGLINAGINCQDRC